MNKCVHRSNAKRDEKLRLFLTLTNTIYVFIGLKSIKIN